MPKTEQMGMFDLTIEDPEIEVLLDEVAELEEPKTQYRQKKKQARELIEKRYPHAVNTDGESGGWVRIGRMRFQLLKKERKAGEVKIGAGFNYTLNIEEL